MTNRTKKITHAVIGAALVAAGYEDTAQGFDQYADDKHDETTPLDDVLKALVPNWNGPTMGVLTVADADDAAFMALINGSDETADQFIAAGSQAAAVNDDENDDASSIVERF